MALKIAVANGNWSAAATWESVAASVAPHASTNITLDATHRQTATFTAPGAAGETCTGVVFYVAAVGTAGTMTIELQENSAGWVTVDSEALAVTNLKVGWNYCRFATPYDFAAITADYYRFDFVGAGLAGTTSIAQTAVANQWSYICSYDTTGVPAGTDDVFVTGQINNAGTTIITVTIDGTRTIGSGGGTKTYSGLTTDRVLTHAICQGVNGKLLGNQAASFDITITGHWCVGENSILRIGDITTCYPSGQLAQIIFAPSTGHDWGLLILNADVQIQGKPKSSTTLWRSNPDIAVNPGVTNDGETIRKFVTNDAVNWDVGDFLVFSASAAADQTEYRYIQAKTDASTYTLESSLGGGNAPLTNAHSTATYVVNMTRNIVIKSNHATLGCLFLIYSTTSTPNIDWVQFTKACYVQLGVPASVTFNMDYCSIYAAPVTCLYAVGNDAISNIIISDAKAIAVIITTGSKSANIMVIKGAEAGFYAGTGMSTFTLTNPIAISCVRGLNLFSATNFNIYNPVVEWCGDFANNLGGEGGCWNGKIYNLQSGTYSTHTHEILGNTGSGGNVALINPSFGSGAVWGGYYLFPGLMAGIQQYDGVLNDNRLFQYEGIIYTTGAGLADTKVRTAGTLNVKMAPYSSRSLKWSFLVLARPASTVAVRGYLWRTATPVTINLYLPGSTTADATQSFGSATDTAYQPWIVSAYHSGTVPLLAKVEIVATGTALYVADIDDGTNLLNNLTTWHDGQIVPVIYDELGDPGSVWSYVLESSKTAAQWMEIIAAIGARCGKNSGFAAGPAVFRNIDDTANLVTITFDANGNVTNVVIA